MITKLNSILEKRIAVITLLSVAIGVIVGKELERYTFLVPWFFAFFSFSSSLGLRISGIKEALKKPLPIVLCLLILYVIAPLVAFVFGFTLFPNDLYTIIGLVLAFTLPAGIVSLMWVSIYGGNRSLSLSIVIFSTLISPLIIPMTLSLLVGEEVLLDTFAIMSGIIWMVIIPSLLGITFHKLKANFSDTLKIRLSPFAKISLMFVIMLNSSVASPYFKEMNSKLFLIGVVVLVVSLLGFMVGFLTGKLFKLDREIQITLMFNSGIRNIGVGAAIAITYFPAPVVLPVVITILFQQVLASLCGYILKYLNKS